MLTECGEKGVKGAVVLAGGFGEASPEGAELEARTIEVAKRYGVRIIGPNTNGIFDAHTNLNMVGWAGYLQRRARYDVAVCQRLPCR